MSRQIVTYNTNIADSRMVKQYQALEEDLVGKQGFKEKKKTNLIELFYSAD